MSRVPLIASVAWLGGCSSSLAVLPTETGLGTGDTAVIVTGVGDDDDDDDTTAANEPPVADAGPDLAAMVTDEVPLDGSGSADPDGDPLTWQWSFQQRPNGSTAAILDEERATASFYPDRAGLYVIVLTVSDGLDSDTDQLQVNVTAPNDGPVANAGLDQAVDVGDRVLLNGSSSYDPNADALTYAWQFVSQPPGASATLTGEDSEFPQFTAAVAGSYVIQLTVSDGSTTSQPDEVKVTATAPSSSGCISCEAAQMQVDQRLRRGQQASAGLTALLLGLGWRRRRRATSRAE